MFLVHIFYVFKKVDAKIRLSEIGYKDSADLKYIRVHMRLLTTVNREGKTAISAGIWDSLDKSTSKFTLISFWTLNLSQGHRCCIGQPNSYGALLQWIR